MRISDWSSDVCSSDLAVVEQDRAAGEIKIIDERHHARGRRLDRRAGRNRDVHARVPRAGLAVVHAPAAEAAADAALTRPDERRGEIGTVVVAGARGAYLRLPARSEERGEGNEGVST